MAKKDTSIKAGLELLVQKAKEEQRAVPVQRVVPSQKNVQFIRFSFSLLAEEVDWFRDVVSKKRKSNDKFISYSNSDLFKDGLELLKIKYPNCDRTGEELPTRSGRKFNSIKEKRFPTSFSITEEDRKFIYDFIYYKLKISSDGNYSKSNFIKDLIDVVDESMKD